MDGRIRERLQDLATDAPSGPSVPPTVLRRAKRRVARNVAVGTLALGLAVFGLVAGVRTLTSSPTLPAGKPAPRPTRTTATTRHVSGHTVRVRATQAFTGTGIRIRQGEVFSVTATGTASYRPGKTVGPGGVAFNQGTCAGAQSLHENRFIAPGIACWSLIGRIGASGVIFYIGPSYSVQAPVAGELFLGFNDSLYTDNSGGFRATVRRG